MEQGALVVDPGVTGAEFAALGQCLKGLGLPPTIGLPAHPHWDTCCGLATLANGPRWATPRAAGHARAHLDDARSKAGRLAPGGESERIGLLSALPGGAETLDWAGPLVEVLEQDGHPPGHAALYLPGDGVLIGCGELEATGVVCASAADGVPGDQGM